jgi:virulence-associated protein VagC
MSPRAFIDVIDKRKLLSSDRYYFFGGLMRAKAKVFKYGRSQAVRLPKQCRFLGSEVLATKVGDRVILAPLTTSGATPWAADRPGRG